MGTKTSEQRTEGRWALLTEMQMHPQNPADQGNYSTGLSLRGHQKSSSRRRGKPGDSLDQRDPNSRHGITKPPMVTLTSPQTQTPSPLYVIMLNHVLNKALKIKLLHKVKLAALSHKKLSFIHEETFISACSLNRVQMICGCFSLKAIKMCSESSGWLFAKTKLYLTGENSLLKWTSNTRKDISNTCKTDRISLKIGFE